MLRFLLIISVGGCFFEANASGENLRPQHGGVCATLYRHLRPPRSEVENEASLSPANTVSHRGMHFTPSNLRRLLSLQSDLLERGIHTRIEAGADMARQGDGVLVLEAVHARPLSSGTRPGDELLFSRGLPQALAETERDGGAIIFDPWQRLSLGAYANVTSGYVPGRDWVIALQPNSSVSTYTHEKTHIYDRFLNPARYQRQLLSQSIENRRTSFLGRALWNAGAELERNFLTELNATGNEFRLFFEQNSFPPAQVFSVTIYRAMNERKVAIGRILMDPSNPDHYLVYLQSRVMIVVPVAAVGGALTAASMAIIYTIDAIDRGSFP